MPRTLNETYELQRLADEMEARRLAERMREKEQQRKPGPEERVASLVADGWSAKAAWEHVRGYRGFYYDGGGVIAAYKESQDAQINGLDPSKLHDRKSGRKKRRPKKCEFDVAARNLGEC